MEKASSSSMILCPKSVKCYPVEIKKQSGNVSGAENLLSGNKKTAVLRYSAEGEAPQLIFDLGAPSTGGYPVFKVVSKKGTPVVRLAYSDWYDYIVDPVYGKEGDFKRGCCKYLGVELPVLPGDPNRYNLFTITRCGEYISPLVQGQQRWLMLTLDTPESEVEIEYLYIHYTSDMSPYDGSFSCDSEIMNKLWYASVWTCQIASIPNSQTWDAINGTLLLRTLAKGNDCGVYTGGIDFCDYTMEFDGQIAKNPHCVSGIGWVVRAQDKENGYVINLDLDGTLHTFVRKNSVYHLLQTKKLNKLITDNTIYHITTTVKNNAFATYIDDELVDSFTDDTYKTGTVGFCQTTEKWALSQNLKVSCNGKTLFADNFENGLDAYDFTRSLPFVSDGAKRDRLPWIGDLDWAGRNIYYAFKKFEYMPNTFRMFAFNQTPEGYIWGTCYPENTQKPAIGSYGYYESDLFSAWMLPSVADYVLFTGDIDFSGEIYDSLYADLEYLWRFVEADGLFMQRYATSKGLWDHVLNSMGKFTYNNIVVMDAFAEGAFIAENLGKTADAQLFNERAAIMKKAIFDNFWDEEHGWLKKGLGIEGMCEMSNSIALSISLFPERSQAESALNALLERTPGHGKITALMIRGAYNYDFDTEAISTLIQPGYKYVKEQKDFIVFNALDDPNFDFASHGMHPANWLKSLNDWRGPATTWECMTYPPYADSKGGAWGDRSHPDTAVAHILSGYVLGVLPTDAGFKHFAVKPHTATFNNASGIVPSKFGDINMEWKKENGTMSVALEYDGANILDKITLSKADASEFNVTVNGSKAVRSHEDDRFVYFTYKNNLL